MDKKAFDAAVWEFNEAMDYSFDPAGEFSEECIRGMCDLARMRGRADIAERLQVAAEVIL
jgi:hypothetical protein